MWRGRRSTTHEPDTGALREPAGYGATEEPGQGAQCSLPLQGATLPPNVSLSRLSVPGHRQRSPARIGQSADV